MNLPPSKRECQATEAKHVPADVYWEVLVNQFAGFKLQELLPCRLVCVQWQALCAQAVRNNPHLVLSAEDWIREAHGSRATRVQIVREENIVCERKSSTSWHCPNHVFRGKIRELTVRCGGDFIRGRCEALPWILERMPHLQRLFLRNMILHPTEWQAISALPELTVVEFANVTVMSAQGLPEVFKHRTKPLDRIALYGTKLDHDDDDDGMVFAAHTMEVAVCCRHFFICSPVVLHGQQLYDESLVGVPCPSLVKLSLQDFPLHDKHLGEIEKYIPNLEALELGFSMQHLTPEALIGFVQRMQCLRCIGRDPEDQITDWDDEDITMHRQTWETIQGIVEARRALHSC